MERRDRDRIGGESSSNMGGEGAAERAEEGRSLIEPLAVAAVAKRALAIREGCESVGRLDDENDMDEQEDHE